MSTYTPDYWEERAYKAEARVAQLEAILAQDCILLEGQKARVAALEELCARTAKATAPCDLGMNARMHNHGNCLDAQLHAQVQAAGRGEAIDGTSVLDATEPTKGAP